MKITAKLAATQLRVNRSRTLLTVAAIALSCALTTAVCSLAVSANGLLVSLLGPDYGDYGAAYRGLLLLPAAALALVIAAMSVVVISNVFRVSAGERRNQFGILKCVGATGRQVTGSVLYESVFLSAIGLPLGLLLGLALAFLGARVANVYLGDFNALIHLMMFEVQLALPFVVSLPALALSALFAFLTVLFSAWLPAHKAASASAVDCIRGGGLGLGQMQAAQPQPHISALVRRFFGFEGVLALRNLRRSRRSFRATVTALSVGVVLFLSLGAMSEEAGALMALMHRNIPETAVAEYTSGWAQDEDWQRTGAPYSHPLDSRVGAALTEIIAAYDGGEVWGIGADLDSYHAAPDSAAMTPELRRALDERELDAAALEVEIITLDDVHYHRLCEAAEAADGAVLLLNRFSYNENGRLRTVTPYTTALNTLTLYKKNGDTTQIEIGGVLSPEQVPEQLIFYNDSPVRLILPQATVRGYSWYAAPQDLPGFLNYAQGVLDEAFPAGRQGDYGTVGFNTRAYEMDDYLKVMNIAIVLVSVFLYTFVALLVLIGFTNVISTMSTNVLIRACEFAVLQSVGMTPEGLRRMLALEAFLCAGKALAIGLPVGLVMTWLLNLPVRQMFPIPYRFPAAPLLLCTAAVLLLTLGTTLCAAGRLRGQNLIESIRGESG